MQFVGYDIRIVCAKPQQHFWVTRLDSQGQVLSTCPEVYCSVVRFVDLKWLCGYNLKIARRQTQTTTKAPTPTQPTPQGVLLYCTPVGLPY